MPTAPDNLARVAAPPLPVVVPLVNTDFLTPTFATLLMHEDLDVGPPLVSRKKKTVSLQLPAQPRHSPTRAAATSNDSEDEQGEDLTLSKIAVPRGGPSHVKDSEFAVLTGWTDQFIH